MSAAQWITGQQEHDWFPEPCLVYSTMEVDDGGLVRKDHWIGPFTLDQAVAVLWRVRRWNIVCNVTIDDGSGAEPFGQNGVYTAEWNPSVPDEAYLNEVDLNFRFVQPTSGGLVALFLTRNALTIRHPARVMYYNGADGKDDPGYYVGGIVSADGPATGGLQYNTSVSSGVTLTWSLPGGESASIAMAKPESDTRIFSGIIAISPQSLWTY